MDWEFGISRCKLLHLQWISPEVLLHSTENYIQSLGTEHDGRQYEKKKVHLSISLYIYERPGHYAVQQKLTQLCKSAIL